MEERTKKEATELKERGQMREKKLHACKRKTREEVFCRNKKKNVNEGRA